MPVTDVKHDLDNLTLTITAEFAAPVERIWQVYADPRQLEKVWGPPTYPATVVDHDLTPGGRVNYFMTSPEGEKFAGYWKVTAVDEPRSFSFEDGFADLEFNPNPDLPVSHERLHLHRARRPHPRDVRQPPTPPQKALQKVLDMGVVEGASAGDQPDRRARRLLSPHPPSPTIVAGGTHGEVTCRSAVTRQRWTG